jgi:nucleoside-diphosphate-sugar epimerase
MGASEPQRWFLFGGLGFIGQHLAASILQREPMARVSLLDIRTPEKAGWNPALTGLARNSRLDFVSCDIRQPVRLATPPSENDVLVNLAAIHREPGHQPQEYFETNIKGAENITKLAQECGCREIIFTSSISVYGEFKHAADEDSSPQPQTPYGQSKLKAEQIHQDWAARSGGRLVIIRPGVVFGPGERGNVSRLLRESLRRQRAVILQPDLAKAGIYIEELVSSIHWLRNRANAEAAPILVNGVSQELLHFNDYGNALQGIKKFPAEPLTIPMNLLSAFLALARPFASLVPAASKFHPERLAKLTRPNAIVSRRLREWEYPYAWPLERAMADWLERGI